MNDGISQRERDEFAKWEDARDRAERFVLFDGHELVIRMKDGNPSKWLALMGATRGALFPVVLTTGSTRDDVVIRAVAILEEMIQTLQETPAP